MIRLEIIVNQAIEDDIIEVLSIHGFGESFTYLYPVFGRGKHGRREGSAIWPEENVMFVIYLEEELLKQFEESIKEVKKRFPDEGLQCYLQRGVDRII